VSKLAIISDVHGDVHALRDALAQIDRLDCDQIVCGGDLVDWGLFPAETIELLRERKIPCIRGNHDRWATGRGRADDLDEAETGAEPYPRLGTCASSRRHDRRQVIRARSPGRSPETLPVRPGVQNRAESYMDTAEN
jgi:predicted phosphodiesterase